jgi:phosphatidylglycerophosphate synthase
MSTKLNLANFITISRYFLAAAFAFIFLEGSEQLRPALVIIMMLVLVSDVVDGYIARASGSATSSRIGAVLDSMADDFVIVTVVLCLHSVVLLPLWFALLVLLVRSILAATRLLSAVDNKPYPKPRWTTKLKGATYWVGLLIIVAIHSLGFFSSTGPDPLLQALIIIMAISTCVALVDFTRANRDILKSLFTVPTRNTIGTDKIS